MEVADLQMSSCSEAIFSEGVLYIQWNMILGIHYKIKSQGYKPFFPATQLSMEFIMLINDKMPTIVTTIVGILTFISMINTTPERLKARNFFICRCLSFFGQLKFYAQLS